jgi:hypothetical protein
MKKQSKVTSCTWTFEFSTETKTRTKRERETKEANGLKDEKRKKYKKH